MIYDYKQDLNTALQRRHSRRQGLEIVLQLKAGKPESRLTQYAGASDAGILARTRGYPSCFSH